MIGAVKHVLHGVLLPSAARTDVACGEPNAMSVILKRRAEPQSHLRKGTSGLPAQVLLLWANRWLEGAKDPVCTSGPDGSLHRSAVDGLLGRGSICNCAIHLLETRYLR